MLFLPSYGNDPESNPLEIGCCSYLGISRMTCSEVRAHAGLEPAGAHGIGAPLFGIQANHRSMAGKGHLGGARLGALHTNLFLHHPKGFPAALVPVFRWKDF
jgi:hypothetical protein